MVYLPILFQSIQISFSQYTTEMVGGERVQVSSFVGFENYKQVILNYKQDGQIFTQVLLSGLGRLAFELPAILLFSLFMAVMLNQKMAGRALFRSIFFMPVIISTGVIELAMSNTAVTTMGADASVDAESGGVATEEDTANQIVQMADLQWLFANMSVGQGLVEYVLQLVNEIFTIVNRSGVQMLIFLAALQSVSPAIYESCKIDGATGWETFWKITFPMISPMILVNAIYTVIDSFTRETNPVMKYIAGAFSVSEAGVQLGKSYSTAMAWIYFLIVALIIALIAGVMSAFVFYGRKND
ncbi:MAG: sugar ABC transporter permease [Clostridia bacterium]|nr:sugar ABC transporter permease [Clostridia bacterium]